MLPTAAFLGSRSSLLPFSRCPEVNGHPGEGTAEAFPFEDPTPSGPSQSLSRFAGAVMVCGMASAADLMQEIAQKRYYIFSLSKNQTWCYNI